MLDGAGVLGAASTPPGARDRCGGGIAGVVGALVASGEPVLVACADAPARARHLTGRLGGFALCSWPALIADPGLAAPYAHVVALDPPPADVPDLDGLLHLAWGDPELGFAFDLRAPCAAVFRALRAGHPLETVAAASPWITGLALRVLCEVGLVQVDRTRGAARVISQQRTALERSATFRAAQARLAPPATVDAPQVPLQQELVAA